MHAVRLTIPAKPEYITLGRLALAGLALLRPEQFPPELLGDVKLALTEACTNSVRHAYDRRRRLGRDHVRAATPTGWSSRSSTRARASTAGARSVAPRAADDELSVGGLGIAIIEASRDELAIAERAGGGSTLRFVKQLS